MTIRIGLVGPCGAGKTTLAQQLRPLGVDVRQIAQEHSYTPDMWQRISKPDILIFLDVSYPVTLKRKSFQWSEADYQEQRHRLRHARQHADFYLNTDPLTPDEVLSAVLEFLDSIQ
ncbi:MAG TPA: hypothetical protein EYP88_06280 [Anaerolineales bacterium]|nr:hypothetical protein [Anaerolineales bacterium]